MSASPTRQLGRIELQLRQGLRRWWQLRAAPSDSHLMTQRNIYILPTRAGLMFTITVLTLLLASINYQLNLGYVLTFLLAGSGVVSMQWTHNTLRGLRLHLKPVPAVFAGSPAPIEVVVSAPASDKQPRYGIGLVIHTAGADRLSWVDVPAGGQVSSELSFTARQRGLQPLPRLTVQTRFPLGLFRAWTIWRPAARCLVYPQPEADPPPLPAADGSGAAIRQQLRSAGSGSESDGIRNYRRGDPLKTIVWRKAAKLLDAGGELLSREPTAQGLRTLWLDWQSCAPLEPEQRLSRLTAWVIAADRLGINYGLRLPSRSIAPAHGELHRRNCLEALATWR
ncbi:DUF58 domain-containing protein [Piscinibacter sakaiensis]|uniref:DUF58 domain-containing protein n=1 Tax=Piscinibacter sakaiensis TaxID=1547922 RepID=UPI003AAB5D78